MMPMTILARCRHATIPKLMVASIIFTSREFEASLVLLAKNKARYKETGHLKGHVESPTDMDYLNTAAYGISGQACFPSHPHLIFR